ncbi:MAG TPA: transposase [Ferruginibacter sp.]|nr:transposase [Ferruginibacter sp.]HRO16731.1 transposase [Ferruginibacter sp.]HRQ19826.1 transposase [Ferruginibacter sp.]
MSRKYKFRDNNKLYFTTFTVTNWIDLFIRDEYKNILLNCIRFCQREKDLEVYAWCIMTSHAHFIFGSRGNPLSNIMRDLKRHSSEELHKSIKVHPFESRREWMLAMMKKVVTPLSGKSCFQLWQPESHPVELSNEKIMHQKLNYLHNNPVASGFVQQPEDWHYSSAIDYYGGKGLLDIILIEPMIVTVE